MVEGTERDLYPLLAVSLFSGTTTVKDKLSPTEKNREA